MLRILKSLLPLIKQLAENDPCDKTCRARFIGGGHDKSGPAVDAE